MAEIIKTKSNGHLILVVSAFYGVTNQLEEATKSALESESNISKWIESLQNKHNLIANETIQNHALKTRILHELNSKYKKIERILYGIAYTGEITDTVRVLVLSQGERLSAIITAAVLEDLGIPSKSFESDKIGIVTDSVCDNATANLSLVHRNLTNHVLPFLEDGFIPVITGYFGCTEDGKVSSFGRNGSDYSAAVIASALNAESLHIWKDVNGFMTADPKIVKNAKRIDRLSYNEAAELSYFGARILHPRTVEPLYGSNIQIHIHNIYSPKQSETIVKPDGHFVENIIKSVTFNDRIAVLKIHGAGVGHKPGIIGEIGNRMSAAGINIFSVITSQTCINLLLDIVDSEKGINVLKPLVSGVIDHIENRSDIALIAVVGEGLIKTEGLAARVFSAVAQQRVNVEMFAAGASEVAYYFIVNKRDMIPAITAVHSSFFEEIVHNTNQPT